MLCVVSIPRLAGAGAICSTDSREGALCVLDPAREEERRGAGELDVWT